jgi:hypothetical protein
MIWSCAHRAAYTRSEGSTNGLIIASPGGPLERCAHRTFDVVTTSASESKMTGRRMVSATIQVGSAVSERSFLAVSGSTTTTTITPRVAWTA